MTESPGAQPAVRVRDRQTVRSARYALVGVEPAAARRIWFVLHGYGMLASRFLRAFESICPADTCIVAPEALSRFYLEAPRADGGHLDRVGATWLTREARESDIADAHRWLDAVYDEVVGECQHATGVAPVIGVLGFSQGVATAMRWLATGHPVAHQFVAWAGGLAQDVNGSSFAGAMRGGEIVIVAGESDPFATPAARAAMTAAIVALDVPYRQLSFAGGHHLESDLLAELLAAHGSAP